MIINTKYDLQGMQDFIQFMVNWAIEAGKIVQRQAKAFIFCTTFILAAIWHSIQGMYHLIEQALAYMFFLFDKFSAASVQGQAGLTTLQSPSATCASYYNVLSNLIPFTVMIECFITYLLFMSVCTVITVICRAVKLDLFIWTAINTSIK